MDELSIRLDQLLTNIEAHKRLYETYLDFEDMYKDVKEFKAAYKEMMDTQLWVNDSLKSVIIELLANKNKVVQ